MNLLPLEYWRMELGYNPWHFWGCSDPTVYPVTSKCNDVVRENAWMGADELGREEIRQAIETAEKILFDKMEYWPAPKYSHATVPWPRFVDKRLYRTARRDALGGWIPVLLPEGYIQDIGIERRDVVGLAQPVVYTDVDGDGLAETFTVTVATSVTDPSELAIYTPSADRIDDTSLSERWRILPVTISIAAGTATIKGKRWLMVKPVVHAGPANYPIVSTDNSKFLTTVDVYRRYTYINGLDSAVDSQAALIWESKPCTWGCSSSIPSSTDPASEGWVTARCGIRNNQTGIVVPAEAVYNAVTGEWTHPCSCFNTCGEPDRVLIRYQAGYTPDALGNMDKSFRTLVTRLSCAEMTRRICACDTANREWSNWQFDVSRVNGPETYQANLDMFNNPLGTRRGHLFAWAQIQQLARTVGALP